MLTARGWHFNQAHDAVVRPWPGARTVEITFSPGYHWQEQDHQVKTLTGVPATLAGLTPVATSEVIRDLHFLTS